MKGQGDAGVWTTATPSPAAVVPLLVWVSQKAELETGV